ncbi:MAG: hypothetical protein HY647_02130 [Acidobacteria bacterium]|nr:hypothetical protein [Acidobacteriota bacterium]
MNRNVGTSKNTRLALGLAVLGGLVRLIPHPANFTPVGSMSLFAGARLAGWQAYLVPLLLMALTDPILGAIYGYPAYSAVTIAIYASLLINVAIGRRLRARSNPAHLLAAVLFCSAQFFVLTNVGVWLFGGLYPPTAAGLAACFLAAIPFYGRTLAGDLVYAALLFGLHAWFRRGLGRPAALAPQSSSTV